MKLSRARKLIIVAAGVSLLFQVGGFDGLVSLLPKKVAKVLQQQPFAAQPARAVGHYTPTGSNLVNGTTFAITSGATTGNTGSWKGALALETAPGLNWSVSSTATGLDQEVQIDGVQLQSGNKMVVTINASSGAASLTRYYQICDWVSSDTVDEKADANCTTGGWRTMNKVNNQSRSAIAEAAQRTFTWHIFNGYWSKTATSTSNSSLSTPLSNFIATSNGRVLIRAYSTSTTFATHQFNSVALDVVVDPVYMPSGMTVITGTNTGVSSYTNANNPPTLISGQNTTGSDNLYAKVSGTAGSVADFYMSFTGVTTYTGMNTILVVAEYGCSAIGGVNHRPKIYNFNSLAYENLSANAIACHTTDAGGQFSVSSTSISNYISSSGEVRIEWVGDANSTTEVRLDYIYIIVGSTNADNTLCEISFGTGTAAACTSTTGVDTSKASTDWTVTSELESAAMSHAYYAYDNDADANSGEAGNASNLSFPVTVPHNASVAGAVYAVRILPGSATVSAQPQLKDYAGISNTFGGWANTGNVSNSSSTYAFTDSIGTSYLTLNAKDYVDTYNNRMNMRFRTGASTLLANYDRKIDFAMVSIRWVYATPVHPTLSFQYTATGGILPNGVSLATTSAATTGNTGDWRGTLLFEAGAGYNWSVSSTPTGLDQELIFDGVALQGGNKMVITTNVSSGAASLTRYYQICDWVSATNVDENVDSNCTGGGWRTLNRMNGPSRSPIAEAAQRTYVWHIYDGYWNATPTSTTNSTTTTPLSNFIGSSNGRVLVRVFSTNTTPTTHMINSMTVAVVVDPVYFPAGMTVTTGTNTGSSMYVNAENPPTLLSATNASGSDNFYAKVSGTAGSIADYYLKFTKVRTYTGMNAILVAAETGCSAVGINYKLKIYNFTSQAWEDLSAAIACAAAGTDTVGYYSKSNITMGDYVSSTLDGEVRVGMYGQSNGTQELRLDYLYIIVGTVNGDSANCEIDFGTGTATDCTKTRAIDTSSADSVWSITSALESTAMSTAYYALDNDADANSAEAIEAGDLQFSATVPTSTSLSGLVYAMRWRSGSASLTSRGQFRDYSGVNTTISGGFTDFGTTNASAAAYTYEDPIARSYYTTTPDDYVDYYNNKIMMRIRTSTATSLSNVTGDYDFMMVSMRWVVAPDTPDITMSIDSSTLTLETITPGTPVTAASSFTITTSNSTGYVLTAMRNDSVTTLDLTTDAATDITDKALWVAPSATTTAGNAAAYSGTGLAFRVRLSGTDTQNYADQWWGTDDDDGASTLYAGFPTTAQTIVNSSVAASAGSAVKLGYKLDVPSTQITGVYDGTVTFTVTSNP